MEKQSPVQRLWELGKSEHAHLITAVLLAVIDVICGMVPYFAAARIIILLLSGEQALSAYGVWLGAALVDTLAQVNTTVAQVDEILKAEEQVHPDTPVRFENHDIEIKDVHFGYHDDQEILHGVSLHIGQNSMTALVGPSGSGKSTLAKLIAGFWDVKQGTITMGGHSLTDIPLHQLYDQVAFVSQDNYLFDDTVRENIRMGRRAASDAEVETAAHAAGCDSFVSKLEQGYDTPVGGGGAHLSGGEKQRISIARAMLKDAPIIILDEATANVDPENEDRLQKAIEALTRNKTILMIAHRLKTVRNADQILVLDDGRIVQQGKHEALISQPGIYADFVGGRQEASGWKLSQHKKRGESVMAPIGGCTNSPQFFCRFPQRLPQVCACLSFFLSASS